MNLLKKLLERIKNLKKHFSSRAKECKKQGDLQGKKFYSTLASDYEQIHKGVKNISPVAKILSDIEQENKKLLEKSKADMANFLGADVNDTKREEAKRKFFLQEKAALEAKLSNGGDL